MSDAADFKQSESGVDRQPQVDVGVLTVYFSTARDFTNGSFGRKLLRKYIIASIIHDMLNWQSDDP